ncbi:MAG TPA: hypothetical protein DEH78_05985 [Solibacterales bacterium]|nr:hypothetical protein [Bryobacterales bacterium]
MNIFDALRGEHALLRLLLAVTGREIHSWLGNSLRPPLTLLEHSLCSHAALEDELLFDQLSSTHAGLTTALASMSSEHRLIRERISLLAESPKPAFAARYAELCELVLDHFEVEERVLFPLAAESISEAQLLWLGREWSRRRGVV